MNRSLLVQLTIIFILTQVVGLLVAGSFIHQNIRATFLNDDPADPINAVFLLAYILVITALLLLIIRFIKKQHLGLLLKVVETLAIFGATWIVIETFIPDPVALMLAILLVVFRWARGQNILIRNAASLLTACGAGALIGVSLDLIPILVFIGLLAVYDLIAVFQTKHMVVMAKALTNQNLAFTVAMPTKEHQFELGTGDLVIPLAVTVAGFARSLMIGTDVFVVVTILSGASLLGLLLTLELVSQKKGRALPALPLQVGLMMLAVLALFLAGFI